MDEAQNQKAALIVATLSSFVTPFMVSSLNIALPSIGREFGLDAIAISWVATSYILSAAIFLIPFGRLADIYGRKKIFVYGITVYALFSLLAAVSGSGIMLIVSRAFQGLGAAMIFSTSMAILISVTSSSERGRVLGINVAAVYLGLSLGPFIGGFLVQYLNWRSIFYVNVLLGTFIVFFGGMKLKGEWLEPEGRRFDLTGSVLFSSSLFLIMYGASRLQYRAGIWFVLIGLILTIFFVRLELRTEHPIIDIRMFRQNSVFAFSNAAAFINYSATSAVTFLISFYLQYVKGLSPQNAGIILVSQPILMAIVSPLAGRLSDKKEPRIVSSFGMALTVTGLLLFTAIDGQSSLTFIIFNLVLLGIGFGLFSSPNTNAVMSSVTKEVYGVASATLGTMRLTGQMLSMGIVMLILSVNFGGIQITPESYPEFVASIRLAFIVFALLCFIGIFASAARGKIRK